MNRGAAAILSIGILTMPVAAAPTFDPVTLAHVPPGTRVEPVAFSALRAWAKDDHRAAFETFCITCAQIEAAKPELRNARPTPPALARLCALALKRDRASLSADEARRFFEAHFTPVAIHPENGFGFLTGYFEPEVLGALSPSEQFPVPVLARPADLVTLPEPGIEGTPLAGLAAVRQGEAGLEPYPDRAAIWAGALTGKTEAIAWLRDEVELFILQVQGSARLRLPDGRITRLVYAGRNGLPYTSIGKILVEQGDIPLPEMSLERLMGWLRENPARGKAIMERNRSYVFFARNDALLPDQGPIGGAGTPLIAGRSLAVDRTIWAYGLPIFLEAQVQTPQGGRETLDRLMIAQDTGSAILGPARGDFFFGSGAAAGTRAGLVRDKAQFIVLVPNLVIP